MGRIVEIDREACIACGLCASVAPQVFRLEGGVAVVHNQQGDSAEKIQQCIDGCPVAAISWKEL